MAQPRKNKKQQDSPDDERSPEETERIREETLKRILSTPPKRHSEMIKDRRGSKPKRG